MALIFAGVAFAEYAVRDLILSRGNLLESNQLHLYFRVNSLFYDPNIFGRDLALVLVALGAYLAWSRGTRLAIAAAVVSGVLLVALAFSYSITSFVALFAGLLVVAGLRWSVRWAAAGGALALVLRGAGAGGDRDGAQRHAGHGERQRGRARPGGPCQGGSRGSRAAARSGAGARAPSALPSPRHIERAKTTVSHTEPITVAAEQGAIGLIVYLALRGVGPDRDVQRAPRRRAATAATRRLLRGDGRSQPRVRRVHDRSGDLGLAGPRGRAAAGGARGR